MNEFSSVLFFMKLNREYYNRTNILEGENHEQTRICTLGTCTFDQIHVT